MRFLFLSVMVLFVHQADLLFGEDPYIPSGGIAQPIVSVNDYSIPVQSSLAPVCDSCGSAHFFSSPGTHSCMRCRHHHRLHLWGFDPQVYVGQQYPIHMPYQAWNVYYYDRPYQFPQRGQIAAQTFESQNSFRSRMVDVYSERNAANRPTIGNIDQLEYSILPDQPH